MPNDQSFDTRTTNPANRSVQAVGLSVAAVASGGGGGTDAPFQLAADQYTASRFPLQWVNPNGKETTRSAYNYTHSQFNYVRSVTVTGGSPPYHFDLVSEVTGVTISKKAPSWNPFLYLWAELVINPSQYVSGTSFTIRCTDQEGTVLTLAMSVTEDDSKFVFMDSVNGSSGNSGTFASPYANLGDIYGTLDTDTTHQDKIIVARAGTYTIDNFDTGNPALQWNENKPVGWIPYPGEAVSFNNSANVSVQHSGVSDLTDCYFGAVEYVGGDTTIANAKVFSSIGTHKRIVWDRPEFTNPVTGTSGTDNTSCLFFSSSGGATGHTEISIVDPTWTGLPSAANGVSFFDFYSVTGACVVGGTARDCQSSFGAWVKQISDKIMVAGLDGYDTTGHEVGAQLDPKNGAAPTGAVIQFIGCKVYRASDGINGDQQLRIGDTNDQWGTVYADRLTILGEVNFEGVGARSQANSQAYISDCVVINDDGVPISNGDNLIVSNNIADLRSNIGDYLDADGNVLSSRGDFGTIGANFAEAGS